MTTYLQAGGRSDGQVAAAAHRHILDLMGEADTTVVIRKTFSISVEAAWPSAGPSPAAPCASG